MEKITGKVRVQHNKKRYTIPYWIDEKGTIHIDMSRYYDEESGTYDLDVYGRAWEKVYEMNKDLVDSSMNKGNQNIIEGESKTKMEPKQKGPLNENDPEKEKLLKKIKELEEANERLKERRGGRPAIGETRKVSLTLPTHIWRDIDAAVRVGKVKQSSVLRDMILRAHEADLLFWKEVRGKDEG